MVEGCGVQGGHEVSGSLHLPVMKSLFCWLTRRQWKIHMVLEAVGSGSKYASHGDEENAQGVELE